jgi:Protein of unknown function (DUF2961)
MPFRSKARVRIVNLSSDEVALYYQIHYTLAGVPANAGYFHAQWRRSNPLAHLSPHTIIDAVTGQGHYVGTYIAWGAP